MTRADHLQAVAARIAATLTANRSEHTTDHPDGLDRAGNPIGARALNGPTRQPRGGPCQYARCGQPVPEASPYSRWCGDRCRRRASGAVVDRPPVPEALRCVVCRRRKRKSYGGKCNGCAGQDRARRKMAAVREAK